MKEIVMEQSSPLGPNIAKRFIRFALTLVGLLILRGILGALPMLKSASAIGDSLLSPLVVSYAVVDTAILVVVLAFGLNLGQDIQANAPRLSELGKIVTRSTIVIVLIIAYKSYEMPTACVFVDQTDLVSLGKNSNATGNYGDFMRIWGQMVGQVSAAAMQNATGEALAAYQKLALAVFRQPPNIYAWIFLILIAIPGFSLIPLVSRNLELFTELVSQAAKTLEGTAHAPGSATAPRVSTDDGAVATDKHLSPAAVVEKVTKLKSLLDAEAISADDFEEQKKRILGRPIVPDSKSVTGAEDLRKLKSLLDASALTQQEYETCKKHFLEQI
jgi:Short C-terminal domain